MHKFYQPCIEIYLQVVDWTWPAQVKQILYQTLSVKNQTGVRTKARNPRAELSFSSVETSLLFEPPDSHSHMVTTSTVSQMDVTAAATSHGAMSTCALTKTSLGQHLLIFASLSMLMGTLIRIFHPGRRDLPHSTLSSVRLHHSGYHPPSLATSYLLRASGRVPLCVGLRVRLQLPACLPTCGLARNVQKQGVCDAGYH